MKNLIYSKKKIVQSLCKILKKKSIFNIIISPGSRNAPIIIHFTQDSKFKTYCIVDERCAGFFAIGMAQQIKKPVIINCTSGSAVVNYYPAVTEAFYQKIPIIIITADRPKEIKGGFEGQSINQENIFKDHVTSFIQLTEDETEKGLLYDEKLINESINKCMVYEKPIHINIPFSEPLYKTTNSIEVNPKIIKIISIKKKIVKSIDYKKEKSLWSKCKKKMILLGLCNENENIKKILIKMSFNPTIVILIESTSHIYNDMFFSNIDQMIFGITYKEWNSLRPNILLTIGNNIISKNIRYLLTKYPPTYHWHIGDNCNNYPDSYYKLTTYWPITPKTFFKTFKEKYNNKYICSNYRKKWEKLKQTRIKRQKKFFEKEKSFSDLLALNIVFSKIPKNSVLQLGNSMIIRYYQFLIKKNNFILSYCNRGTSGIDGSVSTAIGYSINSKKRVTLIIGDISFFYDSNALWNDYTPKNFRVILINNGGGNIFKIISNNNNLPEKTLKFFETKHTFTAKEICKMHNWKYKNISSYADLIKSLSIFWKKTKKPFLLEINTQKQNNEKIFSNFLYYLSRNKNIPKNFYSR
ncbi:2-succinyl-5-enolpyruvyl-6-hydroxy-3-cyclohexene-1-carboxylic-acid synthase [Blattabacterium cuenoti]|uniref:2-succinyl-5-enolpyruvyl-6-hydroxy-3- cyclohexene-1-carboxylic-acid synthase n=1 Tax=Blattabacterium cuenoti TaxID=1653831 RepID=UPI001EEC3D53|nr:2-succinyl-5-enolpyruvyl-6-hydroxy-3-cyclohexene-1-carboxylic-acid synthase [Blattabacterium cuenoti]